MSTTISRRGFLRRAAAGTAGVGAILLVGCGSDEGPNPTATTAPSTPAAPVPSTVPTSAPLPTWTHIPPRDVGPGARRDSSLTAIGEATLYAFGGRTQGVANAELWQFGVAKNVWTQIEGAGPGARFSHNTFYDAGRNRLVVTLGQSDTGFFNDVWSFDTRRRNWQQRGRQCFDHGRRAGAFGRNRCWRPCQHSDRIDHRRDT